MTKRTSGRPARQSLRRLAALLAGGPILLGGCVSIPVNPNRSAFAAAPYRNAIPRSQVRLDAGSTLLLDLHLDRQRASNSCGAHAVASVVDYWMRARPSVPARARKTGLDFYAGDPPDAEAGYDLSELVGLLEDAGLVAVAVGTSMNGIRRELELGRPVIARVSLSAGYLATLRIFDPQTPLLGAMEAHVSDLAARLVEPLPVSRLDHYWVVIGHNADHLIVLDPAIGIRAVQNAAFERAFDLGGRLAVISGGWAPSPGVGS
jgi:hypothetical protein